MIKYSEGYKYQLKEDFECETQVFPGRAIFTEFIILLTKGCLYIQSGYAWDGPSGPTIDTKSFMEGSLVHDALYQLIRMGLLSLAWREQADLELKRIIKLKKMNRFRAWYVYRMVKRFAAFAADPKNRKEVITV